MDVDFDFQNFFGSSSFIRIFSLKEMTDLSQYHPPPTAQDLYGSSSKHFAQAKVCYENMAASDEVCLGSFIRARPLFIS